MINPDWMRENIDGEAIQWAASRLTRRSESRRFLVVISDGVPYDAATAEVNAPGFLGQHLAEVVSDLDRSRLLELLAIGIGYDVSRYYPHAEVIDTADELGRTLVLSLGRLLGSHRVRSRAA
jgi:cobaltochelatase CobT